VKSEITLERDRLVVKTPYSRTLVDRFRKIPSAEYRKADRAWLFYLAPDVVSMVCDAVGVLPAFLPDEVRARARLADGFMAVERLGVDEKVIEGHAWLVPPYRHQRTNLARLVANDRWLLADEMGTGKTACVVSRLTRAFGNEESMPILIVCPKSVVPVWVQELLKHGPLPGHVADRRLWARQGMFALTITNYERLLHADPPFESCAWALVVFDEIHRIKSFTAKTSRICRKLSAAATNVYGLSGTPFPQGLEDTLGVLSAIDPNLLPMQTKAAFAARYLLREPLPNSTVRVTVGYRNVAELHHYVSQVCSRVTKAECLDLPEKVFEDRWVRLTDEDDKATDQSRAYRDIKKDAVARLKSLQGEGTLTVQNVLTESLRLLQVVGGFVPDDSGVVHELSHKAKVEALAEILDEVGDKQVVIWCAFKAEIHWLEDWLRVKRKQSVAVLTGDTPGWEREAAVRRFAEGQARFFVGTQAGGEGINGLQVADTEIFYSRNWNLKDYLQQTDRLHRIGQKNQVTVLHLVARGTVDERVAQALESKASLQDMILSDPEKLF